MKTWTELEPMTREEREAYFDSPEVRAEIEADRKAKIEKEAADKEAFRVWFAAHQPEWAIKYFSQLLIPTRAKEVVLSNTEGTEATSAAAQETSDILVLSGSPGCGKTVAAALWIFRFVADPARWVFDDKPIKPPKKGEAYYGCGPARPRFTSPAPIWMTAARLSRQDRYDEDSMSDLLTTDRLVVDDLGGEYLDKNGFYMGLLDEIVNEREANKRPTIFTTNLNAKAFRDRYGERIYDRIKEGGRFIACGNVSMRKAG